MTITFTLEQIMLLLLFILGAAIGIYLLIVLKNANNLITHADKTIRQNEENISRLLLHLEELSKNTAGFSRELKEQFVRYEAAAGSIIRSGADSMLMISETTDSIRSLTANFNELIKIITHLFKK
jgi:predicted PurR-regulated permease PerM